MHKRDLEHFRRVLEDRLTLLYRTAHAEVRQSMEQPEAEQDIPRDEADEAQRTQQRDLRMGMAESEVVLAQRIEAALVRITRGTYGICFDCGRPIEIERLRLVPWTVRCVDDEEASEFQAEDRTPAV